MSLQFNYREDSGEFQGIQLVTSDDIADKFEAPKNVLASQMWDDINVRAYYYRGTIFVQINRLGEQSGEAYVSGSTGSDCGLLMEGYAPTTSYRQMIGTKSTSGAWLLLEVNPDRKIRLENFYSEGDSWAVFSGTLAYEVNK